MDKHSHTLFRREMLEHREDRLHGDVKIAVPVSWQVIGFTLLAALLSAGIFLMTASYSRVETVSGVVVLDKGLASIVPTRAGIVTALTAREGQAVKAGDMLVQIRSEEDASGGRTMPRRIIEALEQQDRRLANQGSLMMDAAGAEQARLAAQIAGLRGELASLDAQIESQQRLIEVAEHDFRDAQGVAGKGYISRRDLESRETALITRRQQLSQQQQARAAKAGDLAQAARAIAQTGASAQAQAAGVQSSRAEVAQRLAEADTARGYTLTSPVDGTVAALTARLGQPANEREPLMVVMPAGATLLAELYIPTSAAGFLMAGQEVRLAVDAFPYQRFGTVSARIVQISSVTIPKAVPSGGTVPVYLVTAALADSSVIAFGRSQRLLPGMSLSARIITRRQTLLQWLFEPLSSVGMR
jgi:membrane fusion protein